jgi:hypothetical protein
MLITALTFEPEPEVTGPANVSAAAPCCPVPEFSGGGVLMLGVIVIVPVEPVGPVIIGVVTCAGVVTTIAPPFT